ncbi:MAG TPA: prolyl oligopeptidase family serine peptidase [Gemmatimonadales bacterium]|nr:prolyl oligopeptidase family serine peptidase [Gemmatimonadales bacterium]
MRPRPILIACVIAPLCTTPMAAQAGPPATSVKVVTDTGFGTTVSDPYRWLENLQDSAVIRWLHAQNDYTAGLLSAIPGRAALAARIHELSNAGPSVPSVQLGGARLFYEKRLPGEDIPKLYVRDSLAAPERLLIDPEKLRQPNGPHWALDYFAPSWDGRYVAFGVSPGGSESSILRVYDVVAGKVLADSIDRAQFGGPSWRPDGRSFFYNRLQKPAAGASVADRYRRSRVYLHVLGTPDSADVAILGLGVTARVPLGEDDIPFLATVPGETWAFAVVAHGVQNEADLFVAALAQLKDSTTVWRPLATVADSVTSFDVHGDDVYLLSHDHAPRFKLVRVDARAPDFRHATLVVPETEAVLRNFGATKNGLYVQLLDGGLGRIERWKYGSNAGERVPLPFDGSISSFAATPRRDGVLFTLDSWTHSALWYLLDPASGKLTDTKLKPPSPVDFSAIAADEVRVRAGDGTMVPLSIVHRRDLARDGTNPTLLDGYGAYGISYDPFFFAANLAWLERGGIYAVCHVRGGGEYGETWHAAGRGATKSNTWRDFIACGEYLVREQWTSPARLAGTGTSAGGIEIGMAVVERPDLFRIAVPRVGETNPSRGMLVGVSGPANRPEFGDPTTPDGLKNLLAMDAYQHVQAGTAYPAMLLTAGMNDPRVDTWAPAKMTAKLQAATTSSRPILLRVDFEAGHGMGSTVSQGEAELADIMAFLFWQFGVAGFQPSGH